MADTKISALADGGNIQATDQVPVNRAGTNARVVVSKTAIGLGNVDNTSNATERAATATLTNKTISGSSNTLTNLPAANISGVIPIANLATGTPTGSKFIRDDGALAIPAGGGTGDALVANPLSQFAATTSAQLRGVLSDETGTGAAVFATSPTLVTPILGTPASGALTNCTAVPAGQIVGVIPIANLATGTPTGSKFIRDDGTLQAIAGGGDALVANPLSQFAATTSAQLAGVISDETGSGSLVFGTAPTISAPTISGIVTTSGANVTTANALGAFVIDVTKGLNTKSVAADQAFTFSGTPANTNQIFGLTITNTDSSSHTITIPSSFSVVQGTTITSMTIAASAQLELSWKYDGSVYRLVGDPVPTTGTGSYVLANSPTIVTPTVAKIANLTSNGIVTTSSSDGTLSVTATTGSGSVALATSPTLVTPVLGTPTSGNLSNCTADGTNTVGFLTVPFQSKSAAYTTTLADSGKGIDHPSTDANARTFTIDSNANVAYPTGTCLTFSNMTSQAVTIAITSDTLYLAGTGSTGSRTLAQYGTATARKIATTAWLIAGTGLT